MINSKTARIKYCLLKLIIRLQVMPGARVL
jgi:hypothetical protein